MSREAVRLNIYDMYWVNDYLASMGIGVYHSGIEVFGIEYAYGGHPFAFTGVFENCPKDAAELGDNFRFRESVLLGFTDFQSADIRQLLEVLGRDFIGDKYHLLNKNCNHFTQAFSKVLCGNDIPAWINRLAFAATCVPFLEKCLPQEWLTPVALQQSIEERQRQLHNKQIATNDQSSSSRSQDSTRSSPVSPSRSTHSVPLIPPAPNPSGSSWLPRNIFAQMNNGIRRSTSNCQKLVRATSPQDLSSDDSTDKSK